MTGLSKGKLLLLGSFIILQAVPSRVTAQWNTGGDIDPNWIHFGFQLGAATNSFVVYKQADFNSNAYRLGEPAGNGGKAGPVTSGNLSFVQSTWTPGFVLGLLANFRLSDNLDIRFTPGVNFSDRNLYFGYESLTFTGTNYANPVIKVVSSTYLDFPLLLKFKSDRKRNIRSYLIGGLQYSYDIIPKKKTEDAGLTEIAKLVKIQKNGLSYRVGLGLDLYYEYFKMSPEISVTNSLVNVLTAEHHVFSRPIKSLYPTSIQLSLYFE